MKSITKAVLICLTLACGTLLSDPQEDQTDANKRQDQKLEDDRLERQRLDQKLEDARLDRQREDSKRLQRQLDDERWNRAHGR